VAPVAESKEYRIAASLRRCCWYVIVGVPVVMAVFSWMAHFVQRRGVGDILFCIVPYGLVGLAAVFPLIWRLRVAAHGILVRRLFQEDLWSWEDLSSGRIQKVDDFTLLDPERPWWRRKLRFGYMASDDVEAVMALVNQHYCLPPPPNLPATLTFRYGFRRSATFDAKGIQLVVGQASKVHLWHEVKQVLITRADPLRRDFLNLVIELPDDEIELRIASHQYGKTPTWRDATAEEINEFLLDVVEPDRVYVSILGEAPKNRDQILRGLKAARKSATACDSLLGVIALVSMAVFVWIAIVEGLLRAFYLTLPLLLLPGIVVMALRRMNRRQIATLTKYLADFDAGNLQDVDGEAD